LFTFIANLRGWNVQPFDNYEAALTWLSGAENASSQAEPKFTTRPKNVPVRNLKNLRGSKSSSQSAIQIKITPRPAGGHGAMS